MRDLGDIAPVENGLGHAGGRVQYHDDRLVRVEVPLGIAGTDRHQLRAERRKRRNVGRHQSEQRMFRAVAPPTHRAHWLLDSACGKFHERAFHGIDQFGHAQAGAHVVLIEVSRRPGAARQLSLIIRSVEVALRLGDEPVRADVPRLETMDANALSAGERPAIDDAAVLKQKIFHAHFEIGKGRHEAACNFSDRVAADRGIAIVHAQRSIGRVAGGYAGRILATPGRGVAARQLSNVAWYLHHLCYRRSNAIKL